MKTGIELIAAERERQVSAEGWTPEHDDKHVDGQLAGAAATYALRGAGFADAPFVTAHHAHMGTTFEIWPWSEKWWKPTNPVRDLVKAGALIAAEIDRLQRMSHD